MKTPLAKDLTGYNGGITSTAQTQLFSCSTLLNPLTVESSSSSDRKGKFSTRERRAMLSEISHAQVGRSRLFYRIAHRLVRIREVGIRSESNGDYFKSGDLAYQIQEILRATAELLKKSQRVKE